MCQTPGDSDSKREGEVVEVSDRNEWMGTQCVRRRATLTAMERGDGGGVRP